MTTSKNYELEPMEARKASQDWFGITAFTRTKQTVHVIRDQAVG
ncbi:hypothetical protein N8654_00440 [Synechococcus sp. AH-601-B19]|nr:hypothetical protein [Synechococcus sp. AH-601-B19]